MKVLIALLVLSALLVLWPSACSAFDQEVILTVQVKRDTVLYVFAHKKVTVDLSTMR